MLHQLHIVLGTNQEILLHGQQNPAQQNLVLSSPNYLQLLRPALHLLQQEPTGLWCLCICPLRRSVQPPFQFSQGPREIRHLCSPVQNCRSSSGHQNGAENQPGAIQRFSLHSCIHQRLGDHSKDDGQERPCQSSSVLWYQTHGNFCCILIRLLILVSKTSQPS